jgi:hypothetical protein
MIEAGVLVDKDNQPIHWHLPPNRSSTTLPDSVDLWNVIWTNRDRLLGFAHTHPGSGVPGPSITDISTFIAIEKALGRSLKWWIATSDKLIEIGMNDVEPGYAWSLVDKDPPWLEGLREHSR